MDEDDQIKADNIGDHIEYDLPFGWKKIAQRQKSDRNRWVFTIHAPNGTKFRSTVEIKKFLEKHPEVECVLEVTNTFSMKGLKNYSSKKCLDTAIQEKQSFGCDICQNYFWSKSDLIYHIESAHTGKEKIESLNENC